MTTNRVRDIRKAQRLTQIDTAVRCGVSVRTLCTVERGGSISLRIRRRICSGLGVAPKMAFPRDDRLHPFEELRLGTLVEAKLWARRLGVSDNTYRRVVREGHCPRPMIRRRMLTSIGIDMSEQWRYFSRA